jgi:hypothetical protein
MISRRAWQLAMLTLFSGVFAYAPLARAQTDVTNDHVFCASIVAGSIKFSPPLTGTGNVPLTVKVKGKLSGCSDSDHGTIKFIDGKSSFKGTLTGGTVNNCTLIVGSPPLAGTITIKWKTDPTTPITPTQTIVTVPALAVSSIPYSAIGTNYSITHLGTPNTAVSSTGAFGGGEGGVSSASDNVSSEDLATLLNACGGPKGLKKVTIGIGTLSNG